MPRLQRPVHSGTFLVTTNTYERRRLFQVEANAALFVDTLQHYRRQGHYLLHDFVVMPEHIHLLLTPQDVTLERAVGLIKGGFSHRLHRQTAVWQSGFDDRRARTREEFLEFRRYIHQNPVKKFLCATAAEYRWSSAFVANAGAARLPSAAEAEESGLD